VYLLPGESATIPGCAHIGAKSRAISCSTFSSTRRRRLSRPTA